MSFDSGFYDYESESDKSTADEQEGVRKLTDDELVEHIRELENVEHVPENACNRYEVCGNTTQGSDTCGQCWKDVIDQLDFPGHDGMCPECDHRYWKFLPVGKVCVLRCKECGYKEEQEIEYTGEVEMSDWEKARKDVNGNN